MYKMPKRVVKQESRPSREKLLKMKQYAAQLEKKLSQYEQTDSETHSESESQSDSEGY